MVPLRCISRVLSHMQPCPPCPQVVFVLDTLQHRQQGQQGSECIVGGLLVDGVGRFVVDGDLGAVVGKGGAVPGEVTQAEAKAHKWLRQLRVNRVAALMEQV